MTLDALKAVPLLLLAAVVQVSIVNAFELAEGQADVTLVVLVALALLRGPLAGAVAGFLTGLVLDVATFGTLGLTSLLLTLAGYLAGRIGEATSDHRHQRTRALLAVALLTVAVELGEIVVHALLGEPVSFGVIVGRVILPTLALNLAIALPLFALVRRLFPPPPRREREVALV